MSLEWIRDRLVAAADAEAILEDDRVCRYGDLVRAVDAMRERFAAWGVRPGDTFAFAGDYSELGLTRFLAAVLEGLVAVPIASVIPAEIEAALGAMPVDWYCPADHPADAPPRARREGDQRSDHPLLERLRARGHPGIVIMTSGSTGRPKVILQDAVRLLDKFRHPRRAYRALVFLLPDHMGGVNTLFGMLTSGGTLIIPGARTPDHVCALVERHRATLLPVTPTFLNLILISEAHQRYDLSSLRVLSYGTEAMPKTTLDAALRAFPEVRFVQLYGSSELGIFRSRGQAPDSPFIKLAGADVRVVDGRLQVRGADSMLGYLSGQPAGFDADGWYDTGDLVEEAEDGYLRILGRASDLINVGGLKVFPLEVEEAIDAIDGVEDCSVYGVPHALTGQVVAARVQLSTDESAPAFKRRMRAALAGRLEPFKIPVKVALADTTVSTRFKKVRGA